MTDDDEIELGIARLATQVRESPGCQIAPKKPRQRAADNLTPQTPSESE